MDKSKCRIWINDSTEQCPNAPGKFGLCAAHEAKLDAIVQKAVREQWEQTQANTKGSK